MKKIAPNNYLETNLNLEDFKRCYYYFYFQTLKNCLTHPQGLKYLWLSPAELTFTTRYSDNWDKQIDPAQDPFCDEIKDNKILLAYDILKNGNYFPYMVHRNGQGGYIIGEGKHRVKSLQIAYNKKIITNNYKILCIVFPNDYELAKTLNTPIISYPLTEYRYGSFYRKNRREYDKQYVCSDMKKNNGIFLMNEIIIKEYLYDFEQAFMNLKDYPGALRNILYLKKDDIKPVSFINNPQEFNYWLNS